MTPRTAVARAAVDATPEDAAILRSVLYASLFDYPLTVQELRRSLIESAQTEADIVHACATSPFLREAIEYDGRFFFPAGCAGLVGERLAREQRSRAFLGHHRRVLEIICSLPYVRMVALSGSIAHMNLERGGDLDLFIITRGRHVWSITVAVILLAKLMRRRTTVCANFVLSDTRLTTEQQDLFAANQILHLKPLVGSDVYAEFVAANPFVRRFYPNAGRRPGRAPMVLRRLVPDRVMRLLERSLAAPAAAAETICRGAYRRYLERRAASWQSPEQVRLEPDCLKLHTHSHRWSTLTRFDGVSAAAASEPPRLARAPAAR